MTFDYDKYENEEDLKNAIKERLETLYKEAATREVVGFENLPPLKGIIPRETFIDNADAYYQIRNDDYIYEFVDLLKRYNIKDLKGTLNAIYNYIGYYFGKDGSEDKRREILNSNATAGAPADISCLRNQNAALCSERAALAQNLFSFIGVESYYITGEVGSKNGKGSHAFNVLKYNDKMFLYDSAFEVPCYDNDKLVGYRPFLSELDNSEIKYGTQFRTKDYQMVRQNGKVDKKIIGNRDYASGFITRDFDRD